jgi:NAD(P)-dependent dehydrogenase (short-subunit alcohol dehydrogenase family)
MQLNGKVALVTGGASGIGAGVCSAFVTEGATVAVADVDDERGSALADELGDRAAFRHVDVTDEDQIADAVATVVAEHAGLDILVNNAGAVGRWRFIDDTSVEEWDAEFRLLVRSAFFGIKHAVPVMRANGGGCIINTSSVAAIRAGYGPHPYGAAKAALLGLVRSTAVELAPAGIRVNAIVPGGVVSRIVGHGAGLTGERLDSSLDAVRDSLADFQPVPRAGEPADLAAAAVYLASDGGSFVTGHELVIDGGLSLGRAWPTEILKHARKGTAELG